MKPIFRGLIQTRYDSDERGSVRAVFEGQDAIPFSMRPVPTSPPASFG